MKSNQSRWCRPIRWALCLGLCVSPAFADTILAQAQQWIKSHEADKAYLLLKPLEQERAGEAEFDYWLGTAALESGRSAEAAFALERCLAVEPHHGLCRVQMVRTHLALGEKRNARHEIGILQQYSPPPQIARLMASYLGDLSVGEREQQQHLGGYLQLGGGYDSNANSATTQTQIVVPLFGNALLPLSMDGQQQHSAFAQSQAGLNGYYRLSESWVLLGDADLADKADVGHGMLNSRYENVNVGASYHRGAIQYSAKLQQQLFDLDNHLFRELSGAIVQAQYRFSDAAEATVYLQSSHVIYPDDQPFDVDRRTLGLAYSEARPGVGRPVYVLNIDGGKENTLEDFSRYNANYFIGGRTGATIFLDERLSANLSLAFERRQYGAPHPVFFVTRADSQYDVSLGLIYRCGYGLSLRPAYVYTHNSSNLVMNQYSREMTSLDIRYEW